MCEGNLWKFYARKKKVRFTSHPHLTRFLGCFILSGRVKRLEWIWYFPLPWEWRGRLLILWKEVFFFLDRSCEYSLGVNRVFVKVLSMQRGCISCFGKKCYCRVKNSLRNVSVIQEVFGNMIRWICMIYAFISVFKQLLYERL